MRLNWFGPVFCGFLRFRSGFFIYFRIRQPVAVAVRPKIAKKPDQTRPDLKTLAASSSIATDDDEDDSSMTSSQFISFGDDDREQNMNIDIGEGGGGA